MTIKKTLKKHFGNAEKRIGVLYTSSKIVFGVVTLLFMMCYFFIAGSFYDDILSVFFLPLYLAFLMSFICFLCASTIRFGSQKFPRTIVMILCAVILGMGALFILPVL